MAVLLGSHAAAGAERCRTDDTPASAPLRPLFVVAGQSNAAGLASVHDHAAGPMNLVSPGMRFPGVNIYGIYGAPQGIAGKDDPVSSLGVNWRAFAHWRTAQPGFGYKNLDDHRGLFPKGTRDDDLFGPELFLARALAARPPFQHYIVKLAVSNTSLFPVVEADSWAPGAHLYRELMAMVADAYNSQRRHVKLRVAGVLFVQGESDALEKSRATQYAANLQRWITTLRQDLMRAGCTDDPTFPVALAQLQDIDQWSVHRGTVRRAQQTVAANLPHVTVIRTDDLRSALRPQDGVHYGEYGAAILGMRAYQALVAGSANRPPSRPTEASPSPVGRRQVK